MVIHVVTINLKQSDANFLITPGNPSIKLPLNARTTSQFLDEFNLQLAVNGDSFRPWHSNSPLDYYPHQGDPVRPTGFAASRGMIYSNGGDKKPTLFISKNNQARFNNPVGKVYNAISGNLMLVEKGEIASRSLSNISDHHNLPDPRTAIGLDKHNKKMVIVVVDGRQPGYSHGSTLTELAEILIENDIYHGMNLDGGGSTTLVIQNQAGNPEKINSPIDNNIPGRERPIANHLGIYIRSNREN